MAGCASAACSSWPKGHCRVDVQVSYSLKSFKEGGYIGDYIGFNQGLGSNLTKRGWLYRGLYRVEGLGSKLLKGGWLSRGLYRGVLLRGIL